MLPEIWSLKITEESLPFINQARKEFNPSGIQHLLQLNRFNYITNSGSSKPNLCLTGNYDLYHEEITLDQFKLYILNMEKDELKVEPLYKVFNIYHIGQIVVSLESVKNHRSSGDIFKILPESTSGRLYYKSRGDEIHTNSIDSKSWRAATKEEVEAFDKGITNIKDIEDKSIKIGDKVYFKGEWCEVVGKKIADKNSYFIITYSEGWLCSNSLPKTELCYRNCIPDNRYWHLNKDDIKFLRVQKPDTIIEYFKGDSSLDNNISGENSCVELVSAHKNKKSSKLEIVSHQKEYCLTEIKKKNKYLVTI